MAHSEFISHPVGDQTLELEADVLVLGGGPAGAWAAYGAAQAGAKVVVADKGYLGTSGATAPGGTNILYLPPDKERRDAAVAQRMEAGGRLSEPRWIHRVLDTVYESLKRVEEWGYPFPKDENGNVLRNHVQGPEYMKVMRKVVREAGAKILDQSPALELLSDEYGIGGARGVNRLDGRPWQVRAKSVVIATGGCAFLSNGLGCNVDTGEGPLMAVEVGAELSGMEFSRSYAPSAAFGTVTRGLMLGWASFFDQRGSALADGAAMFRRNFMAEHLAKGETVYAVLDKADTPEKQALLRRSHAIFFLPYDRAGYDPFRDRFPLTLRYEGTVRGTGGIKIVADDCSSTIPGLFAAGDAASRERVCGAVSGGGAFNAAWAISSGQWAGAGAARFAIADRAPQSARILRGAGRYGIRSGSDDAAEIDTKTVVAAVQREVQDLNINYFRSEPVLRDSLERLERLWPAVAGRPGSTVQGIVRSREAAAMVATARWMHTAALTRRESRGMHTMKEYPDQDPGQHHRLTVTGLDHIVVRPDRSFLPASPEPVQPSSASLLKKDLVTA